jgi:hypothetical protein
MSLSTALDKERAEGINKGPTCTVCELLRTLDADDLAALTDALDDASLAHAQIYRALRAEGYAIRPNTVARHRRGECAKR